MLSDEKRLEIADFLAMCAGRAKALADECNAQGLGGMTRDLDHITMVADAALRELPYRAADIRAAARKEAVAAYEAEHGVITEEEMDEERKRWGY